jgi:hypothetical protein
MNFTEHLEFDQTGSRIQLGQNLDRPLLYLRTTLGHLLMMGRFMLSGSLLSWLLYNFLVRSRVGPVAILPCWLCLSLPPSYQI